MKDVRLTVASGGAQTEVSNINTRMQNFSEHSSVGAKVWYKAAPVNLIAEHSTTEILSEVKFTVKDFNLTKLSYLKNPQNFNVWYNDGADLLYGVSALSVAPHVGSGGASSISAIRYGTVTESNGTKTFTYMLPTDTAGEYKVVTAIDDCTTAKVTEQMFNNYYLPTSTTDYNGVTQSTTYDQYGNVVTEKTSATPSATMNITTDYGYSAGGKLLTSEKTYRGTTTYTTSHAYDEHNYPVRDTLPNGQVTTYGLNASKEKVLSVACSASNSTLTNNFTYDGDLVKTLAHNGTTFAFAYDGRNNIASVNIGNGVFTQNKVITYNENGTCVSKTTYGNGQIVTKYYNKYDKLVKVTSTSGSTETTLLAYLYSDGEVANNVTNPSDSSLLVSEVSPLRVVINNGKRTTYTYDDCGQVVKITSPKVTIENTEKDDFGRVKKRRVGTNSMYANTSYTYETNVDNTLAEEETTNGSNGYKTIYLRDQLQRPSATKVLFGEDGYELAYSYLPRQQASGNTTNQIGTTTFVNKVSTYKLSGDARILDDEDVVEYDSLGNITKYGYITYVYDGLGRLIRENNPTIDRIIVWEYNTGNNPTKRTEYIYTTGSLGNALKTCVLAYNSNWKDQVTSIDGQSVTYDKAGNPNKYHAMTMTWTRGRLLSTCSLNGKNVEFTYDGDGRRVKKLCSSGDDITEHNYTYDGSRIVADEFSSFVNHNQVVYKLQYFYNQQGVVGFRLNNDYYFFRKNLFGNIIAIYNSYGARVARYAYDAYGVCKVMSSGGAVNTDKNFVGNINPFRYRGYYYDVETKLYYLQSRYYDPSVGRFINADSLEYLDPETAGGLNLYAYCGCDPINYYDPTGTFVLTLTSSAIFFGYLALAGIAITGVLYWESKTHAIGNLVDDIGSALGNIGSSNDNIDTSLVIDVTPAADIGLSEYNPDPYARPGQHKQGREVKSKARKDPSWKPRNNRRRGPNPPKKHTPGRDHKHHLISPFWRDIDELIEKLNMD